MKRLDRTPQIEALLRASFGADADLTAMVVFEFVAANLQPLRKDSGIYKGARFSQNTLAQMAELVGKESVQLILNHGEGMPVGRVFAAEIKDESLHTLVAISERTEAKLVADIDAGVIDQVSVGVMPARLLCSECNFDYMSEEATFDNWWDLTCNEGHTIGVEGVHARIAGAASWFEMSLVGMGAVPGARSVPKDQSAFAPSVQRLAASGVPTKRMLCSNHVHQPKDSVMDLAALTARVETLAVEKHTLEAKVETSAAALTAMTAERDALVAERDTLKASVEKAPNADHFTAVTAALTDITTRALIALGVKEPSVPTDPIALVAAMTEAQTKLTAAIPTTVKSKPADATAKSHPVSLAAFTTN